MKTDKLLPAVRTLSEAGGATIGMVVGVPAAVIVGAVLTTFRWALNSVNAALVFMILVVAVAAIGGRAAGVITAVASTMSFDFFHTQPYLSMTIHSREDIETTALLFIAALLVGGIATSRRVARAAKRTPSTRYAGSTESPKQPNRVGPPPWCSPSLKTRSPDS